MNANRRRDRIVETAQYLSFIDAVGDNCIFDTLLCERLRGKKTPQLGGLWDHDDFMSLVDVDIHRLLRGGVWSVSAVVIVHRGTGILG